MLEVEADRIERRFGGREPFRVFIIEVALQGVAGFPPLVRLGLESGVNVARAEGADARRTLVDLIYHTLYPDPSRREATAGCADPHADDSRFAVTFFGRDRVTYRLIRDLRTGGVTLYRFEAGRQRYRPLTQAAAEAARFVRVHQRLPDDVGYERLFVYAPESMPSRREAARTRSGHPVVGAVGLAPSAPGLPIPRCASLPALAVSRPSAEPLARVHSVLGPAEVSAGVSPAIRSVLAEQSLEEGRTAVRSPDEPDEPDELRAEIARWRTQLSHVKDAEEAEDELDRLQRRKAELVEVVRSANLLRQELDDLERQLDGEATLSELPRGFCERLRVHEERETRYRGELARMDDENERLRRELAAASVVPLVRDPYFVLGVGAAALFVAAAVILVHSWIALLNIPASLIATAAALRYVADREHRYRAGLRLKAAEDHRDRLEKQHRLDTAVVSRMIKQSGVDSAAVLRDRVQRYEARRASYEQARERLEELLADGSVNRAEEEVARLERQVEGLEGRIVGVSIHESAAAIERRIVGLEAALDAVTGSRGPPSRVRASTRRPSPGIVSEPAVPTGDVRRSRIPAFPAPPPDQPTTDFPPAPSSWKERPSAAGQHDVPPPRAPSHTLVDRSRSGIRVTPAAEAGTEALGSFSGYVVHRTPDAIPDPPGLEPVDQAPSFTNPPAPAVPVATDSLFDFEGWSSGEDDDEDGYGTGYGQTSPSSPGEPDSKLQPPGGVRWWAASASGSAGGSGDGWGASPGEGRTHPPDRSRELVESARAVLHVPWETLAAHLQARMGRYLAALTGRRYARVQFGRNGAIRFGPKGSGTFERYIDLAPDTVDTVDAAIRLCLAEAVLREYRVPILVDDPFIELDAHRRELLGQMLQYLGRATQVFVCTPFAELEGHPLSW